jgi:diguanylate cyclase
MLDIDEFKQINDTYEHLIGDQVLVNAAHDLRHNLRSFDLLFRYGGDEFLICAPGMDLGAMRGIAERLRREISNLELPDHRGGHVSIGVAEIEPGLTAVQSIERADDALYLGKSPGRNRVAVWEGSTRLEHGQA